MGKKQHSSYSLAIRANVFDIFASIDTERDQAATDHTAEQTNDTSAKICHRTIHVARSSDDLVLAELANARRRALSKLIRCDDHHLFSSQEFANIKIIINHGNWENV